MNLPNKVYGTVEQSEAAITDADCDRAVVFVGSELVDYELQRKLPGGLIATIEYTGATNPMPPEGILATKLS